MCMKELNQLIHVQNRASYNIRSENCSRFIKMSKKKENECQKQQRISLMKRVCSKFCWLWKKTKCLCVQETHRMLKEKHEDTKRRWEKKNRCTLRLNYLWMQSVLFQFSYHNFAKVLAHTLLPRYACVRICQEYFSRRILFIISKNERTFSYIYIHT